MRAEIAVCGAKHVEEITRTCAERLADADVVFEDLARRGGHVRRAIEEMFDDVVRKRRQP